MYDAKRVRHEKRLLRRLVISHWDLTYAGRFVDLLLAHQGGSLNTERRAYTIAAVVSYWRPFSDNAGDGETLPRLPQSYWRTFTKDERKLHDRIGEMRNQAFAHSDPVAVDLKIRMDQLSGENLIAPSSRDPLAPLADLEARLLRGIIDKLLQRIGSEHLRIQQMLRSDETF